MYSYGLYGDGLCSYGRQRRQCQTAALYMVMAHIVMAYTVMAYVAMGDRLCSPHALHGIAMQHLRVQRMRRDQANL